MVNANNKTLYGIEDPNIRYIWAGYHFVVLISSIVGDTIILVASIKYNALKLSHFILATIQHIAVADLTLSVFYTFPEMVSLIADGWILGDTFCYVRDPISYFCVPALTLLVCVMTTGKWIQLKYPFRAWTWTREQAQKTCAAVWVFSLIAPGLVVAVARKDIYFDYNIYNCVYVHLGTKQDHTLLINVAFEVFLVIPNVVIVATSTMLLVEARKNLRQGESLNWRGVSTVLLTALIFSLASVPTVLFILSKYTIGISSSSVEIEFRRVAAFLKQINIMANIYIYTMTVPSFREFISSRVRFIARALSQPASHHTERRPLLESVPE